MSHSERGFCILNDFKNGSF